MQNNNLDIILKEAFDAAKETASKDVWPNIATTLHKRKRRRFLILIFALSAIVTGGSLLYYSINTNAKNKKIEYFADKTPVNNNSKNPNEVEKLVLPEIDKEKTTALTNPSLKPNSKAVTKVYDKYYTGDKDNFYKKEQNKIDIKSKHVIKIKNSEAEENLAIDKINKTDKTETEKVESKKLNPIIRNDSATEITNTGLVKTQIVKEKKPESINTTNSKTKKERKKSSWDKYLSLSYNALIIGGNNVFTKADEAKNLQAAGNLNPSGGPLSLNNSSLNKPSYKTGKEINLALIIKQKNASKKINPQFGIQVSYSNYSNKVYATTPGAVVDVNNSLSVSFNNQSNSSYSARANAGNSSINISNNYFSLGILAGLQTNLFKLNKKQHIVLQLQAIPTLNLSKSINWYQKPNERYFKDKSLNKQFNISQSTALLWKLNTKKYTLLIGPNFNYHFLQLNKKKNNLGNIYSSSVGITTQINF
jgi:hypothetical protein